MATFLFHRLTCGVRAARSAAAEKAQCERATSSASDCTEALEAAHEAAVP